MTETSDRAEFIRENAVVLVTELEAKIVRHRKRIAFLEKSRRDIQRKLKSRNETIRHIEATNDAYRERFGE